MTRRTKEGGYAMVAAVAAISVFALMSTRLVDVNGKQLIEVEAEAAQAEVAAASDAGFAIAMNGLLARDSAQRWSIDGRVRRIRFERADLVIRVEDERGKVPINLLDEEAATRFVDALQPASIAQSEVLRDSLLDWLDEDDEPRPEGAERDYYSARGISPRNGSLQSLEELLLVRGFTPALLARLKPFSTVNFGVGGAFDARYGHPEAIGVMLGGGTQGNPAAIERQRNRAGQRTAIELDADVNLLGRPLTIAVQASTPSGARAEHSWVIELTGAPIRPYVVRAYR